MFKKGQQVYYIDEDSLEIKTGEYIEEKYNHLIKSVVSSMKDENGKTLFFSKDELGVLVFESKDDAEKGLVTFKGELFSEKLMVAYGAHRKAKTEVDDIKKALADVGLNDEVTMNLLIEYFETGSAESEIKLNERYQNSIPQKTV